MQASLLLGLVKSLRTAGPSVRQHDDKDEPMLVRNGKAGR